jgi:hypothetical protein
MKIFVDDILSRAEYNAGLASGEKSVFLHRKEALVRVVDYMLNGGASDSQVEKLMRAVDDEERIEKEAGKVVLSRNKEKSN